MNVASLLIFVRVMNSHDSSAEAMLVRWEFGRDRRRLMCAIRAVPEAASWEVATVPLWDVARTSIETFRSASAALLQHAAIATDLRESGWTVASYTA